MSNSVVIQSKRAFIATYHHNMPRARHTQTYPNLPYMQLSLRLRLYGGGSSRGRGRGSLHRVEEATDGDAGSCAVAMTGERSRRGTLWRGVKATPPLRHDHRRHMSVRESFDDIKFRWQASGQSSAPHYSLNT